MAGHVPRVLGIKALVFYLPPSAEPLTATRPSSVAPVFPKRETARRFGNAGAFFMGSGQVKLHYYCQRNNMTNGFCVFEKRGGYYELPCMETMEEA